MTTPILNALAEGLDVFLLLEDGRILHKRYPDKSCAEVSAEQMLRLQLPVCQLLDWFDWSVHEEKS